MYTLRSITLQTHNNNRKTNLYRKLWMPYYYAPTWIKKQCIKSMFNTFLWQVPDYRAPICTRFDHRQVDHTLVRLRWTIVDDRTTSLWINYQYKVKYHRPRIWVPTNPASVTLKSALLFTCVDNVCTAEQTKFTLNSF